MIILFIDIILLFFYSIFLIFIMGGTFRKKIKIKKEWRYNFISVIAAARNEENTIERLINSLIKQDYPKDKYEIIIINDRSDDKTEKILKLNSLKHDNLCYLNLKKENKNLKGKKNALTKGIINSKGKYILLTDADCFPGNEWIKTINKYFNDHYDAIVGFSPLSDEKKGIINKIIYNLKKLERLSIFTVSAGSIGWNWGITATGRNFAYKKKVFKELNGFSGIGHIPSGDDDLFLQRISKAKKYKIAFVKEKESFVPTSENKNFFAQINQEKRRASKWKYYPISIKLITLLSFIFYLFVFVTFILAVFKLLSWNIFLIIFISKTLLEFMIILRGAFMFSQKKLLWLFPIAELLYIPYFMIFAIMGTFTKYEWR